MDTDNYKVVFSEPQLFSNSKNFFPLDPLQEKFKIQIEKDKGEESSYIKNMIIVSRLQNKVGEEKLLELNRIAKEIEKKKEEEALFKSLSLEQIFNGISQTFSDILKEGTSFFKDTESTVQNRRYIYLGIMIIAITLFSFILL